MSPDVPQKLEDLLEGLTAVQKDISRLTTKSVSGAALRKRIKDIHKQLWLPVAGLLENEGSLDPADVQSVADHWKRLVKLADGANPKAQYKPLIKSILATTETELLYSIIKSSAIQTIGASLRKMTSAITDPDLIKYLDESIACAEASCVRGSVVLAWCAVSFRIQQKLVSLGLPLLESEFDRMRQDQGMMFKAFSRAYKISTPPDVQEIPDAHLILLSRFLSYLDDTEYRHLKAALDLRNGCGHPSGYQPDPIKLQAYYGDIIKLVLTNSRFT